MAAKAPRYTDTEVEALASQTDVQGVVEDLLQAYMEEDLLSARIERDETVLLHYITRQTSAVGARHQQVNGKDQYDFNVMGLLFSATHRSSTLTDHSGVYAQIQTQLDYFSDAERRTTEAIQQTDDVIEVTQLNQELLTYKAKRELLEEILDIKARLTRTTISDNLSLAASVVKPDASDKKPKSSRSKAGGNKKE